MNDEDRRTLGEALSGFSNSAGGLLIWGVDARKKDGVDCATNLVPIQDIEAFQTNVTTLLGQYLMPRHEGVRTAIIQCESKPGQGYLLLDVERSERRPHRSEVSGKRVYFKRVGDSFFEMEHYDIEDAFRRVHVPALEFCFKVERAGYSGTDSQGQILARVSFRLRNTSSKTAKFPYLNMRCVSSGMTFRSPRRLPAYAEHYVDGWTHLQGSADAVIHPENSSSIYSTEVTVDIPPGPRMYEIDGRPADLFGMLVEYRFGCEDSRLEGGLLTLKGAEIVHLLGLPPRSRSAVS